MSIDLRPRCWDVSPEHGKCDRTAGHPDDHQRFDEEESEVVASWPRVVRLRASYRSGCAECGAAIEVDERIRLDGERWVHDVCPAGRMDLVREVCSECFTERSVTGACMCEQVTA